MTFQPWIRRRVLARLYEGPSVQLQWSHDLSAMDTTESLANVGSALALHGAMTFQPWIHEMDDPLLMPPEASMEP